MTILSGIVMYRVGGAFAGKFMYGVAIVRGIGGFQLGWREAGRLVSIFYAEEEVLVELWERSSCKYDLVAFAG